MFLACGKHLDVSISVAQWFFVSQLRRFGCYNTEYLRKCYQYLILQFISEYKNVDTM